MGEHNELNSNFVTVSRRQALKGAIALVGGTVTVTKLAPLAHALMADEGYSPVFLGQPDFALLSRVVDLMIPETDTPGALGAGVHRFIDAMLAEWANEQSRARFGQAMRSIKERALELHDADFADLAEDIQFDVLAGIDREAFADGGSASPYTLLKKLVLLGYYSSEQGATTELRYNPIPGAYTGCVPLEDIGRAYYKHWGISGEIL